MSGTCVYRGPYNDRQQLDKSGEGSVLTNSTSNISPWEHQSGGEYSLAHPTGKHTASLHAPHVTHPHIVASRAVAALCFPGLGVGLPWPFYWWSPRHIATPMQVVAITWQDLPLLSF